MILSQKQIEEIAAAVTEDFNKFFFGTESEEVRMARATPIDQFARDYLKMTGIPYAPIYGDIVESRKKNGAPILKTTGVSRSGCMYCMYGVHLEHEPNRFQLMQVTHPQQYDYCINKLGCGAVLDYIGVPYRNQQLEVDHC